MYLVFTVCHSVQYSKLQTMNQIHCNGIFWTATSSRARSLTLYVCLHVSDSKYHPYFQRTRMTGTNDLTRLDSIHATKLPYSKVNNGMSIVVNLWPVEFIRNVYVDKCTQSPRSCNDIPFACWTCHFAHFTVHSFKFLRTFCVFIVRTHRSISIEFFIRLTCKWK